MMKNISKLLKLGVYTIATLAVSGYILERMEQRQKAAAPMKKVITKKTVVHTRIGRNPISIRVTAEHNEPTKTK